MLPEYNGWTNYPTWNIHLWITNDQGLYEAALEVVNQDYEYNVQRDDALKDWAEDTLITCDNCGLYLTGGAGTATDLINWALSHVDWREITDALREE